jgi:uncharacterized membrane protein SpoIIM required for sporulation
VDAGRFAQERQARWSELEALVAQARGRPARLGPDGVLRLGELYRASAADLAVARRRFPGDPVVDRLHDLVRRARQAVYSQERRRLSFVHFVTTGYWQRVRERPGVLVASILLLMGPYVLSAFWADRDPGRARGLVPGGASSVTERNSADFHLSSDEKAATSSAIFTNNIRVAFLAFATGIALGLGSVVVLLYQGIVLGATFGLTIDAGNSGPLFEFVFPHGVLELSCIVVAGAAGMRMGWAIVAPGYRRRGEALREEARAAVEMALGTALVLVFCGIVEGSLSTSGIGLGAAIAVGVTIGTAFWSLVVWRGRPDRADEEVAGYARPEWEAVRPLEAITAGPATSP